MKEETSEIKWKQTEAVLVAPMEFEEFVPECKSALVSGVPLSADNIVPSLRGAVDLASL